MASNVSQAFSNSKEQFRDGDGDEEDAEGILDPRVKGELDRLNSSTAEINCLEQDLEELRAAFRQTLTESAYVLKSQAAFLGNCVKQARPYYDAVRKAKQSQIETQTAALKYERACSAHQAAKKVLAIAEQKLVSTSKEHKVLEPSWQEMLNQAVLKVMESDKERALSEKEHLATARTFSAAGSKVTELRTKLKSAINKSRPYFDLKMKYDQILQAHKRQVEITQESLQAAKKKYSLALKNLEGISEEIHEMRRSRDSLDTILTEREEGVGAESPVGDLSFDAVRPETELPLKKMAGSLLNNHTYGFKIALVSSSRREGQESKGHAVGYPVGERDGDPEGCSSLDEQQPSIQLSKHWELAGKSGNDSEAFMCQGQNSLALLEDQTCPVTVKAESVEVLAESCSRESGLDPLCQGEKAVVHVSRSEVMEEGATQGSYSPDGKEQEQFTKVALAESDMLCSTDKYLVEGEELTSMTDNDGKLDQVDESAIQGSVSEQASDTSSQGQKSENEAVNEKDAYQLSTDKEEMRNRIDNEERSEHVSETATKSITEAASVKNSEEEKIREDANGKQVLNQHLMDRENTSTVTDNNDKSDHLDETAIRESVAEAAFDASSDERKDTSEAVNENVTSHYSTDSAEI